MTVDPEEFADALTGLTIIGAELHEGDGFHFHLSDGRTLVIVGSFVMGLTKVDQGFVQ